MELMTDLRQPRDSFDKFLRDDDRLQRAQTDALDAFDGVYLTERIQQRDFAVLSLAVFFSFLINTSHPSFIKTEFIYQHNTAFSDS